MANPSRISTSSSTDLHVYSSQDIDFNYGPQEADDTLLDLHHNPSSRSLDRHSRTFSTTSTGTSAGGGRSRTRAASLISTGNLIGFHSPIPVGRPEDAPFASPDYDNALAPTPTDSEGEDDEEAVGVELRRLSKEGRPSGAGGGAGRSYRNSFQPLIREEWYWMGASALSVAILTVAAVILTFLG